MTTSAQQQQLSERVSDEELARIVEDLDYMPMSQAATRPQAMQICKELQLRREKDRKVRACRDKLGTITFNEGPLVRLIRTISEIPE